MCKQRSDVYGTTAWMEHRPGGRLETGDYQGNQRARPSICLLSWVMPYLFRLQKELLPLRLHRRHHRLLASAAAAARPGSAAELADDNEALVAVVI